MQSVATAIHAIVRLVARALWRFVPTLAMAIGAASMVQRVALCHNRWTSILLKQIVSAINNKVFLKSDSMFPKIYRRIDDNFNVDINNRRNHKRYERNDNSDNNGCCCDTFNRQRYNIHKFVDNKNQFRLFQFDRFFLLLQNLKIFIRVYVSWLCSLVIFTNTTMKSANKDDNSGEFYNVNKSILL